MPTVLPPVEDPSPSSSLVPTHVEFEAEILTEVNRVRTEYLAIEEARLESLTGESPLTEAEAALIALTAMSELIVASRETFATIRNDRDTLVKGRNFNDVANPLGPVEGE